MSARSERREQKHREWVATLGRVTVKAAVYVREGDVLWLEAAQEFVVVDVIVP